MEVLFFAKNSERATSEYAKDALVKQIGRVSYLDQEQMKAYLQGSIDSCEQVWRLCCQVQQPKRKIQAIDFLVSCTWVR